MTWTVLCVVVLWSQGFVGVGRAVLYLLNRRYWRTLVHVSNPGAPHMYLYSVRRQATYAGNRCCTCQSTAEPLICVCVCACVWVHDYPGRKVTRVVFAQSRHVDHFLKHSETYR